MAATAQEIASEIARLQDRLRVARTGLATLDRNLQSNQDLIAGYTQEVAVIPGQVLALQVQLRSVVPPASAGDIVANANQARDENANAKLPSSDPKVLTPTGRIEPDGSGAGTNAKPTPDQQNNPTVGIDAAKRTIAETQAVSTNNANGTIRENVFDPRQEVTENVFNPTAPVAGPGAGAGEDTGTPSLSTVVVTAKRISESYPTRLQSYVYQAVSVVSSFKQGKFEQSLKGILYTQQTANTTQTNAQQREVVNTTPVTTTSTTKTKITRPPTTAITTTSVNDVRASAGVNDQGNFTGETGSPFTVVAP